MLGSCRICGGDDLAPAGGIRETMFGAGTVFEYSICGECGCLQIEESIADMSTYYPPGYYSFERGRASMLNKAKTFARTVLAVDGPPTLFAGRDWYEKGDLKSIRKSGIGRSGRIADVGCGSGELIRSLKSIGFANVVGIDPFITADIQYSNGARVLKREISQIDGEFDLIMMHHSLEHVWDQAGSIKELRSRLAPRGRLIVRIPTVECWAWQEYGSDWVQIDAPRHFYLHSRKSIQLLLEATGFDVEAIVDDSGPFHLLGSEKIRRGLPLIDPDGGENYERHLPGAFIRSASLRARQLNREGRGDAIAVHAVKRADQ